jgi:phosphate:Na+ symporter
MSIYSIFTLCGGLAFFLFGMHVMSGNLEKVAGGRLEGALKKMTSNRLKALSLGAVITVAIQSSSALTVMLVGLVNSGIMNLSQTVGVIMGSNIGTTLTAWILSMSGIQSDSFLLSMLKPENFSPIIALIGVIMMMVCKNQKKKDIGVILAGFAVLMFGMELMKNAVAPLAESPKFAGVLTAFNNPILGVIIGTVFTGIIQSSAASVGVLQALALTGSITYGMAIPIIMGQNIGTCVTALLSSIGVNRNARRVAVVHISFNMIGTILCMIIFFIVRNVVHLDILNAAITPVAIAGFHSVFNLFTTAVLLPFGDYLVRIAELVIPDRNTAADTQTAFLEERLLITPAVAVAQARERTLEMARLAREAYTKALDLFEHYTREGKEEVEKLENRLDEMEDSIGTFLIRLSGKDLTDTDSSRISEMLHSINDFERIGDHAINAAESAFDMHQLKLSFSPAAQAELKVLHLAIREILDLSVECFEKEDAELASHIEPLEEVIDELTRQIKDRHIHRLTTGECDARMGIVLTDLLTDSERVSDHCSNVAVCIIQSLHASFAVHGYLSDLKGQDSGEESRFVKEFRNYSDKYALDKA